MDATGNAVWRPSRQIPRLLRMAKRLILLGASVRAAAFSALRAGFEPYAIDCYADRDLTAVCPAIKIARYPHDFPTALTTAPDAPWLYTGGLENHPRLIDRLAAIRPLLGNGGSVLRAVRDPAGLAAAVREAGLEFPDFTGALNANHLPAEWLVKPIRGSGGLHIRFAMDADRERPRRRHYFQRFVAGQAASANFVAAGGAAMFLGASRHLLGGDIGIPQHPFAYAGSIGPLAVDDEERKRLNHLGGILARQFVLSGLFGVDFVRSEHKLWILEVNPRYAASVEVLEHISGRDFLKWHVAACEKGTTPTDSPHLAAKFAGKRIVYANRNSFVSHKFDALVWECNRDLNHRALADLPQIGQAFRVGQPIVTVLAEGNSEAEVESKLGALAATVDKTLGTES